MKKRKHITVMSWLLGLALLLAACGGDEDISGKVEPAPTLQEQPAAQKGTDQKTEEPSEKGEKPDASGEQKEESGDSDETMAPEGNPLALGRLEGGVYTNTYLGIGCTLDSDWIYYSAQELQELPEAVANAVEGTDIGDLLDEATQIMDMQAENVEALVSMNIGYTKLGMQDRLGYLMLSEEEHVELLLGQREQLEEAYNQMGITIHEMKKVTVTYLGEEHLAVWTYASVSEVPYYIVQIQNYRVGEFGATLTVSSFQEDRTQEVLDLFYALED